MAAWLKNTVFYEVYPQSFRDFDGDGIGDIRGITEKLDYILELGCSGIWLNPCFDSPFMDAGYDVRDYYQVAERYGTNEDLYRLFEAAHQRGMHVILDLVPGHTSDEHAWFAESSREERNPFTNRYIWTDSIFERPEGYAFVAGNSERSAVYLLNFFLHQPALNYGFYRRERPWQLPADHPDCKATRDAMKEVILFWLRKGCDGFRVDMASSLVKNDTQDHAGTRLLWRQLIGEIKEEYPEAVFVSEWGKPQEALDAGFDCDFLLPHTCPGFSSLMRGYQDETGKLDPQNDRSYFRKSSSESILPFLQEYERMYEETRDNGFLSMMTGNHDVVRPGFLLGERELKLAYAFLFTMPGVPFLYYGDEIGMKYLFLKSKEGGYYRTGSRTPMQWTDEPGKGFSEAPEEKFYLPVDSGKQAPTVEEQKGREGSLWQTVRDILQLRMRYPQLQADGAFRPYYVGKRCFGYFRENLFLGVNPSGAEERIPMEDVCGTLRYRIGDCGIDAAGVRLGAQSFCIVETGWEPEEKI